MIVFFKPWVVIVYTLIILAIIIYNVVVEYNEAMVKEDTLEMKVIQIAGSGLLNLIAVGGVGLVIFLMFLLLANGIKPYNSSTNTSTYTNKSILELSPVRSIDGTDYFMTKDFEEYTYTFAIKEPETGNIVEHTIDFDHTIIIPFQDCKTPSVVYTHNEHEYYECFNGNFWLEFTERHFTRKDYDNYNDLLVFLVPMNSVMEFKTEERWV